MLLIQGLTNDAKQKMNLILPSNGKKVEVHLEFKPQQVGWFLSFTYETFSCSGLRICSSPNVLRQYKNLIPFGLACFVEADQEPMFQTDWSSARANLYLLTTEEVQNLEDVINGESS